MIRRNRHRKTTTYVGRLTVDVSLLNFQMTAEERVIEFNKNLIRYIQNAELERLVENPSFEWKFGDIEVTDKYVFGRLGKIRKGKTKFVYNEDKKSFLEVETNETEAEVSNFLISLDRHIIVFEERPHLGYKEFMEIFKITFSRFFNQEDALTIELLTNKQMIESILRKSRKIVKTHFVLTPSNPDMNEESKLIDEELKKMRADSIKLDIKAKNGLDYSKPNLLRSAIAQGNQGYGHYTIKYENDQGDIITYESKRKTIKEQFEMPENLNEVKTIFKQILNKALHTLDEE